jgi:deoxyribodipyrimidine photolyase
METAMQLIWLRSDLRQHDNTALAAAAARGPTVPCICRARSSGWNTTTRRASRLLVAQPA